MPKIASSLLVAGALLVALLPATAASSVLPTFYDGPTNRTCGELAGEAGPWLELKDDTGAPGTYVSGNLSVTITDRTEDTFSWTSNVGVDAVYVKGGSGGSNLYAYDPESTGDTGLWVPNAARNAISHVSFCWDDDPFVPPESLLTLFKAPLQPSIDLGDAIGFALILGNGGGDPAENATIWDELPAVSGSWSADNAACAVSGTNLTCGFGTVAVGEFRYVNVTAATASVADCGLWRNVASSVANDGLGTNAAVSDPAEVHVTCADVGIEKTAGSLTPLGGNVSFAIAVTSYGPDAAQNVTLGDALPAMSGGWTLGGADASACAIAAGFLSCSFGALAPNETRQVTLVGATGAASDCGWINNTAAVAARLDVEGANDESSASAYVVCADVAVQKAATAANVTAGGNVTWTITIASRGPDDASNVTLADALPNGSVLGLGGNASAYCGEAASVVSCSIPTLAAGSSLTLEILASSASVACGAWSNTASSDAALDIDASNDAATASVEVVCPIGTTRTQGFWATHTSYTQRAFAGALGGSMTIGAGGHARVIDTTGKLFGAWLSSIPTKTDGSKRAAIDAGRMALLQQLVTAKLNCAAFGCNATTQAAIAGADAAYAAGAKATMASYAAALDAYNNGGDAGALPAALGALDPASPALSKALANRAFWNAP